MACSGSAVLSRSPERALTWEQKAEARRFEEWDEPAPHPFQTALAAFINLADDYETKPPELAHEGPHVPEAIGALPDGDSDPDPWVTPPLYGRWHSNTTRLVTTRDGAPTPEARNWVHELNLDPRHRASVGLGARVVRERQEEFMNAAWAQIGQVLEANRLIRLAQLGRATSLSLFQRHFARWRETSPERLLVLTGPLLKRVVVSGFTVQKLLSESRIPAAMASSTLRRALRPSSKLVRYLVPGAKLGLGGRQVPLPHGEARTGSTTAAETLAYVTRLLSGPPPSAPLENEAKVRYELMTRVPENWIPFVLAHVPVQSREIQLQRASMPRLIPGRAPEKVKPRTCLMRAGLDQKTPAPYFLHEEEVPRAGAQVRLHYQRTRWTDGRAVVWLGAEKRVGRGEGSSGLEFDRLVELKKPNQAP